MEKKEYYRKRFYVWYHYDTERMGYTASSLDEWKESYEEAYATNNERLLKRLDRELTVAINEYPLEMRREIYKRMEAELGIDAGEIEKKYQKKIQTILNRGRIKNRGEYELIHSHVDSLSNGISSGKPIPEDLLKLHRILMDYSMSFDPTTSPHRDD